VNVTEQARRSDALYCDNIIRRDLCDMIAHLEADRSDMEHLVQDMLMTINNAARGFSVHPKAYRDYYSRAKKLKVKVD
jgi:hypothetical protein